MEKKAGYKTTEFWATVVTQLVGLLATAGVFTPATAEGINQAIAPFAGLAAMVLAQIGYTRSREKVKVAESAVKETVKRAKKVPAAVSSAAKKAAISVSG